MITFKYKEEKSGVLRPVADIVLHYKGKATGVFMYIDSGADISVIPRSAGQALGFSESKTRIAEMKGLSGGGVPYVEKTITATLEQKHSITMPVAWALIEEVPALLGRKGVFSKFTITFTESDKIITFRRKKKT